MLDDFWDLSSLVPKSHPTISRRQSTEIRAVEISDSHCKEPLKSESGSSQSDTVIKRYVNPLHYEQKKIRRESFEHSESYYPENSLLHKVTLKKRKSEYRLYGEFVEDARRYSNLEGDEVAFEPYYSYVPQYNQLTDAQVNYYLWWRKCFREGVYIKTDYSYVLLYVFELINLGKEQDVIYAQGQLARLWNTYHKEYSALASKLATWICDFSLIHRLPMPKTAEHGIGKHAPALKEFYLEMPKGDYAACARSLIKYGTEYDYRSSKFANQENREIFDRHIFGAMLSAVEFYSKDGVLLSELASEDSRLVRNSFEGALCASEQRYEIEVKYCSFSRSNELRYIMGDIVKYAENKIRAYLGIKSRLSVYSVSGELQRVIDAYFENSLINKPRASKKKEEKQEYDALYDLQSNTLSLEKAKRIEQDSWGVTIDLISAFESADILINPAEAPMTANTQESAEPSSLSEALGECLEFARSIKSQNADACKSFAAKQGKLIESVIDEINEIAVEIIGDTLIEEGDEGYEIIDCYRDLI